LAPRWSHDGQWIYFNYRQQIYRISPSGSDLRQVTRSGGYESEESPDGRWIYYTRASDSTQSLYRVPSSGGESTPVIPGVAGRNFIVLENGIWYFTPNTKEGSLLEYYDFATKSRRTVFRTSRPVFAGMSISPDRRRLLFTQTDRTPSRDLLLVEKFQ
jgi:Tol biopolymer transport system component